MNQFVQALEERLRAVFQHRAAEFSRHAEEEPSTAYVTAELAGLYRDLVEVLSH
ncbi:MAG TPA: hypothetical protein V6D08_08290 [Candidatus Obscuribacterales bacterium]